QLLYFFLGLVTAGHIGKSDVVVALVEHACARLAKRKRAAASSALHLAHEKDPHADQEQHREPGNKDRGQQRLLLARLDIDLYTAVDEVAHQSAIQHRCDSTDATVILGDRHDLRRHARFGDRHGLDPTRFHLSQEVRVRQVGVAGTLATFELLEYGEKYERDHHPDGGFREHAVV